MLGRLAPYRLRLLFRGAFLFLALATLGMALYVLYDEKQRGVRDYREGFAKTRDQIAARLRHPAGQLALLNPQAGSAHSTPLHPVLLPFAALDFDDRHKVQTAVEMAGCLIQYEDGATICVAIGNNPWAGGFIYVAGSFASARLVPHRIGDRRLDGAHRLRVAVSLRGQHHRWVAPFEQPGSAVPAPREGLRGRLTGFVETGGDYARARPVREFRGWIWQSPHCLGVDRRDGDPRCERRVFYSLRLPLGALRDDLFHKDRPKWPPADLDEIDVRIQAYAPGNGPPLFDSNRGDATRPFALADLESLLLPGESLRIRKASASQDLVRLTGEADPTGTGSAVLARLIRGLPVPGYDAPIEATEAIATPAGRYLLRLEGDVHGVDRRLNAVATRLSGFVGVILLALALAWAVMELGIMRRIGRLTRRAQALSQNVQATGGLERFDLSDARGSDELGILGSCLHDLLQRVKQDVARERIRTEQEKDLWHAVGHEIMSPLQSLMALHGGADDPGARYIHRMQRAVKVLYGSASPSEAFEASPVQVRPLDLAAFLRTVAENAPFAGVENVRLASTGGPVRVQADEHSLEDVITHVLRNADRYRTPGSPITLTLNTTESAAEVVIHNAGPPIPESLTGRIFEYGVSDQPEAGANGNRGQGLFVARTYMAKMGGTITAANVADGVEFVLTLPRLTRPATR